MKSRITLLPFLVILASCGSKPLTEAECKALRDKELAYVAEIMPPGDFSLLESLAQGKADKGLSKCVAGDGYDRDDYECIMGASGWRETGKCMRAANEHIKL